MQLKSFFNSLLISHFREKKSHFLEKLVLLARRSAWKRNKIARSFGGEGNRIARSLGQEGNRIDRRCQGKGMESSYPLS